MTNLRRPAGRPRAFSCAGCRLIVSFLCFLIFQPSNYAFSQEEYASSSSMNKWILAASKFENISVKAADKNDPAASALIEQLPRLMLNNLSSNLVRLVPPSELESRVLSSIISKRNTYFSELTAQIQKRDVVVFSASDAETLKKNIAAEELKITEIEKKIKDSIEEEKQARQKQDSADAKPVFEKPELWKNDSSALFKYEKKADEAMSNPRGFETAVSKEKISALITGSVRKSGDLVSVTAVLTLYPGKTEVCRLSSVGLITDTSFISESLMSQMMPYILNAPPVDLFFTIGPPKAAEKVSVFIEDGVYRSSEIRKTVRAGIKEIRIESPGCKSIRFTHDFSGKREFYIDIVMQERVLIPLTLSLPVMSFGSFNIDAMPAGKAPASVVIDAKPHIGELVSPEGWQSFFFLDFTGVHNASVKAVTDVLHEDISDSIDKKRRKMYRSYGYVLMAMPLFFITRGIADTAAATEKDEASVWEISSYVSAAGVLGLLCNMGWNMYNYFTTANRVLPSKANVTVIPAAEASPAQTEEKTETPVPPVQALSVVPDKKIQGIQKE